MQASAGEPGCPFAGSTHTNGTFFPLWHPCDPERPEIQVHDLAVPPLLTERDYPRLHTLLSRSCRQGLELQLIAPRPSPSFSLVDFANQVWKCGGEQVDRVVIVASKGGGIHARVPWMNHRTVRNMAHRINQELGSERVAALEQLTQEILRGHLERKNARQILLGLEAVSILGILILSTTALRRRIRSLLHRQGPGPVTGT
ncbi:MAG: hypothetical protein ABID40_00420 [Candidatus Bipolaricaulota bacterium]